MLEENKDKCMYVSERRTWNTLNFENRMIRKKIMIFFNFPIITKHANYTNNK